MKAKNQQHFTSDHDAKDRLIVYVYDYLVRSGANEAADKFVKSIGYNKNIEVKEGPGFLLEWWCVFWDLYCAAPERRHLPPESSNDAKAFHDYMRSAPMSPSIAQASPPHQGPPSQFMGGQPRYGPPPPQGHMHPRAPHPRMQGPPPPLPQQSHGGPPFPGPPGSSFMPAGGPNSRYIPQHPTGPSPHPHMNQGPPPPQMGFSPGPELQMGPSPGLNRMTPVGGGPPPPMGPGPSGGPPPQMVNMPPQPQPGQQMGGPPGSQHQVQMQAGGPPSQSRGGSQGNPGSWQGSSSGGQMNPYGVVNSPANQSMYNNGPSSNQHGQIMMSDAGSGMMDIKNSPMQAGDTSTPHSEEYVLPVPFGQETGEQCDSAEIMKIKQSMQDDAKMFDKEQSDFSLAEYNDSQGKWS